MEDEVRDVCSVDGFSSSFFKTFRLFNRFLHLFLGVSLVLVAGLTFWIFFRDIYYALVNPDQLIYGLLHALGTLLILWTISELIATEIRCLGGERVQVAVFVDVAIAATLRKLLIGDIENSSVEAKLVNLAALVVLGIVRWALTCQPFARRRESE
ncbi:phosphate-starvation-inducible PsiE family protein [Desulfothermobacter acidiphilus]|uniref:phosphate-starvation-inducible PsiE family protein n=1 Tax=Desulfothermobacter acidiphilus TaxID=1938353 RepID=UPI003F8B27AB